VLGRQPRSRKRRIRTRREGASGPVIVPGNRSVSTDVIYVCMAL